MYRSTRVRVDHTGVSTTMWSLKRCAWWNLRTPKNMFYCPTFSISVSLIRLCLNWRQYDRSTSVDPFKQVTNILIFIKNRYQKKFPESISHITWLTSFSSTTLLLSPRFTIHWYKPNAIYAVVPSSRAEKITNDTVHLSGKVYKSVLIFQQSHASS